MPNPAAVRRFSGYCMPETINKTRKEEKTMKKQICLLLVVFLMIPLALLFVSADDAASGKDAIDPDTVYSAAYGTPVIDGVMDDIYLKSELMYANNGSYAASGSDKSGPIASAEYRVLWDTSALYIWCEVTDTTKAPPIADGKAGNTSNADCVDIWVIFEEAFSQDETYPKRTEADNQGQFRVDAQNKTSSNASWALLTEWNLAEEGRYQFETGYLNPDDTEDGSYFFEVKISYNTDFAASAANSLQTKEALTIGAALQISDQIDDTVNRDAITYSNNATGELLSGGLHNCGRVLLALPEEEEPSSGINDIRRDLVYTAAYGTPVVDGEMDDIYLESDVMYANNAVFGGSASVTTGQTASAEYRIVWNETTLFLWCVVTDPTRSDPGAVNATATKMDNTDIYVNLDSEFDIETDYTDMKNSQHQGMFRYQPNCTAEQEPLRSSWGGLTYWNQDINQSLHYAGGYLNPEDPSDGSYYFELSFDFYSKGGVFEDTLLANAAKGEATRIGFSLQVNDVMDNDAARDALIYSNNASGKLLSSNLKNAGVVLLAVQEGAEVKPPEQETDTGSGEGDETDDQPSTTEPPRQTDTEAPATSGGGNDTEAPGTTAGNGAGSEDGCKSAGGSIAVIAVLAAAGGCAVAQKGGRSKRE